MNRLIQALAIVAIGAVAQGCVHHNHGTRRVVVHSEPVAHTSSIDYRYHGYHPVPHNHGGGWCNLDHVHVHHYQPLASYGYTYYDSYNYWVYSRPRVIYYYGGHYDRHGRFCNHRGRHSHDYLPSRHAASAYSWDARRNSYVYAPDRRSRAVRGVAPRATPPAGRGVARPAPRRSPNEVPSVSPGSRNVRTVSPRSTPVSAPSTAPRTSPSRSVDTTPRVSPRTSPSAGPSAPSSNETPRIAPRSRPSTPAPAPRSSPSTSAPAPRSSPSTSAPAPRSSPPRSTPSPRAEPRSSSPSSAPAPAVRAAPKASPRSAPAVSRPSRPAPSRSVSAPGRATPRPNRR